MIQDPTIRKSVVASVIASILVILFIQPILQIVVTVIIWSGENLYEGVSNRIYTSAALGLREKFSYLVLGMIVSIFAGLITGVATAVLRKGRENRKLSTQFRQIFFIAFAVFFLLYSTYFLAINFADLQLNASFNQRITVLSPKISDAEFKDLRAAWASMKTRHDYERIVNRMESLASESNIVLPKLLWE